MAANHTAEASGSGPRIDGRWLTDDGKAVIAIVPCGPSICGSISQILDKGPNVPTTDRRNPDPRRRTRPLIGLPILTGFSPVGSSWTGGRAYDPKTGKSFRASLSLSAGGQLIVKGCALFFCESKLWMRMNSSATSQEHR